MPTAHVEHEFGIRIDPIWFYNATEFRTQKDTSPGEFVRGVLDKAIHPTDHNKEKYVNDVRVQLKRILQSRAGRALAGSLRFHSNRSKAAPGKAIVIMPLEYDDCNAEEVIPRQGPKPTQLPQTKGLVQSLQIREPKQAPELAYIGFSPATLARTCHALRPGTLPQEMLYHELVHALRDLSGSSHRHVFTGRLTPWDNSEEFLAVLMTDIFVSDSTNHHKTGLRKSHQGHDALDSRFGDSFRFFRLGMQAFSTIATFCRENHGFSRMLADVPASFNPIAAYYKEPQKAFEMAVMGMTDEALENLGEMEFYVGPNGTFVTSNPGRGVPTSGSKGKTSKFAHPAL